MSAVKSTKGKRYSEAEKGEIIEFVKAHDAKKGRGGKSAGAKKYGVSLITLSSWLKGSGVASKRNKKASTGTRGGAKANAGSGVSGANLKKLRELTDLATRIDKAQADLIQLHKRFDALKATL